MIAGSSAPRTGTRAVTFEALKPTKTNVQCVIIHCGSWRRDGHGDERALPQQPGLVKT